MRWLDKLKAGMKKTAVVLNLKSVDSEDLEEALIRTDMGFQVTNEILKVVQAKHPVDDKEMRQYLHEELVARLEPVAKPLEISNYHPFVVLMIGVNGAGKTTTIAKLAHFYKTQGKSVACVAADTFRAGAVEQLQVWGQKVGMPVYAGKENADAAGLVYDSLKDAQDKGIDILFVDTAGRLQNRTDLMDELKKIIRVIQKLDASAPHATLLVLDATVGQNALSQVQIFKEQCGVSGLVLTKLDGTAKGGVLFALANQFHLPIYAIGVGEGVEDLQPFSATEFVDALLNTGE
ncbi:MAG: signal recognition particle-docking protein FtsY [Alphaproteobacteria bacterium]|nr:signal recognition particle-docking protein FtsY [Alphaproteobacteria bacterium]